MTCYLGLAKNTNSLQQWSTYYNGIFAHISVLTQRKIRMFNSTADHILITYVTECPECVPYSFYDCMDVDSNPPSDSREHLPRSA